mgnify:CR=1 FL=1
MPGLTRKSTDGAAMCIAARIRQRMCLNPYMENGLMEDVLRPEEISGYFLSLCASPFSFKIVREEVYLPRPVAIVLPRWKHFSISSLLGTCIAVVPGSITFMPKDFMRAIKVGMLSPLHP